MDSNSAQKSSEKPQVSSGSNSRVTRSRHSTRQSPIRQNHGRPSRNRNKTPPNSGRKGGKGSKNTYKSPVGGDSRYQQSSGYRSSNRHHHNKGYKPEEYNNHNTNYKGRWRYNNPGRKRNRRNPKWQPPSRYDNLSWQRNSSVQLDDAFQIQPPFQDRRRRSREFFDDSVAFQSESFTNWSDSNYFWQDSVGNQQFFDRPQDIDGREFEGNNYDSGRGWVDNSHRGSRYPDEEDWAEPIESESHPGPDCIRQGEVDPERGTQVYPENQDQEVVQSEERHQEEGNQPLQQDFDGSEAAQGNLNPEELQPPLTEISEAPNDTPNRLEFQPEERLIIKQEPPFFEADNFAFNIKPEPPDATDSDFDLGNCLHDDAEHQLSPISVIPISKLIKSELQDLNRVDIATPTTPARGRPTLRPNLVQRRKKSNNEEPSGTLTENLIKRVANMDKVGIKNVINNSGTKYDAALKIQARKRLREEIRKQLKSMNFTPSENSESSVLVPDEIVDSMNIPAVVLDEIRKAFGIVLVEDMNVTAESQATNEQPSTAEGAVPAAPERPSKSPDLMSRLKILEEMKSQTDKPTPSRPVKTTPKKHAKSKTKDDVVVINSSSSSSSSSSSDSDSDSSSTSTDSNTSRTSSYKRRRRKKRILEANVVGNFEKLILPNLTDAQRRRYKEKYSNTTKSSLLYIYGVCVSRAQQTGGTIDAKEKLKLKRNLTAADNAQALEFLMKAILNLFEQHKEKRRKEKITPTATKQMKSGNRGKSSNPVSPSKKPIDSTCNQENCDDVSGRRQSESANSTRSAEHQSTKVDDAASPSTATQRGGVNRHGGDSITECANSAQGERGNERLVAEDSDSESDLDNLTASGEPPSRLWKSPGEKKCIEIETSLPMSNLGMMQPPIGIHTLDLESLKSQSSIGDEAVSSIREIDVKLMELHKRKMYIEEMILKLQKDKMEVDLWTMKLQNEKFILLNSALASASGQCPPTVKTEKKPAVKRKPFSTPFSEKLRNRKKRCQHDILLDEAESGGSNISKLVLQPRRTRSRGKTEAAETKVEKEVVVAAVEVDGTPQISNVEVPEADYSEVENGNLEGWKLPITQIIVVGEAIVAASEDGNIYKFNIRTRQLESKFSKHTEAITQIFTCCRENFVYTTSLDGFFKKTSVENFGLEIQSINLQEPLQSIDIEWGTAFIGSRWGNIFTYDIKNNNLSESLLCSSKSSIIALKATKEGPRKILIVSSKGNQINFRDAMTGLLLRSLDVPESLHIYSILLDDGCVFCGTQRNEIHQFDFTTGGRLAIFQCGNGAVSMKLYKDKYIFVGCYDGFVYVLDKTTGCQIGRFPGSGKMILALEIAGDKLITSAKDNTMQIIDIPKYIVTKDKS